MENSKFAQTVRFACSYIAWIIGSGFATGQEILQFFSSYSLKSFLVLLINLVGFAVIGVVLVVKGYDNRHIAKFNHFEYYCGKTLGRVYSVIVPSLILLMLALLISASGATLEQYYSVNRYVGSAIMSAAVLVAYFVGFEKLLRIVSFVSPLVIIFAVFVGAYTVFTDIGNFGKIEESTELLSSFKAAPHWSVSALLYISMNFLSGSTYYNAIGRSAKDRRSAKIGCIIGAVIVTLSISFTTVAILLNAKGATSVSVPVLYLAKKISPLFGTLFSVTLILGMFSSSSTMLWSFAGSFFRENPKKNKLFALGTMICCLALGLVPFGSLLSIVYPIIGYFGLIFIGCVVYKGFTSKNEKHEERKTLIIR